MTLSQAILIIVASFGFIASVQAASNCCEADETRAGCDDLECQDLICSFNPDCCDSWDTSCVSRPPPGDGTYGGTYGILLMHALEECSVCLEESAAPVEAPTAATTATTAPTKAPTDRKAKNMGKQGGGRR